MFEKLPTIMRLMHAPCRQTDEIQPRKVESRTLKVCMPVPNLGLHRTWLKSFTKLSTRMFVVKIKVSSTGKRSLRMPFTTSWWSHRAVHIGNCDSCCCSRYCHRSQVWHGLRKGGEKETSRTTRPSMKRELSKSPVISFALNHFSISRRALSLLPFSSYLFPVAMAESILLTI